MIALKLTSTKNFMKHLLLADTFDNFLLIEAEIVTACTVKIDGYLQKAFFEAPEECIYDYSLWKQFRELCFTVMKGKRTPLHFKLIFCLTPENTENLIRQKQLDFRGPDVQGLYLNIRFDDGILKCTTGTSLKTFSMDKSLEKSWDEALQKFLDKKGIAFEAE